MVDVGDLVRGLVGEVAGAADEEPAQAPEVLRHVAAVRAVEGVRLSQLGKRFPRLGRAAAVPRVVSRPIIFGAELVDERWASHALCLRPSYSCKSSASRAGARFHRFPLSGVTPRVTLSPPA